MTNTTNTIKRNSAQKSGTGIKALIMAGSLAATLGGWGILAVGQIQNIVVTQQSQPIVQPANSQATSNSNSSGTQLRQVSPSTTQPRSVGRTRSSR